MTLPIILGADAEDDFDSAFDWYERQRNGLGSQFAARVQATLNLIADRPEMFAVRAEAVRRAPVRRFPYAVYFRLEPDRIVVLAVVHTSRNQSVWKDRL